MIIPVGLGKNSYNINIERGALSRTGEILKVYRSHADGLYLRSEKLNSRFISFQNKVIMIGFSV